MDAIEAFALQGQVETPDVFAVKERRGFWTFLSRLEDGRWLVEYDPILRYQGSQVLVIGPWGVKEKLPLEADLSLVGRVVLCTAPATLETLKARKAVALLSAHSLTLDALESVLEAPDRPLEGVEYEIIDNGVRSGHTGVVERYTDDEVFRLDTGDEIPLSDLAGKLWPVGGRLEPLPP